MEERAGTTVARAQRIRSRTEHSEPAGSELAAIYAPVAGDLARVERLLAEDLRSPDPRVDELVRHALCLGGKRLRPALVLLVAQACGRVTEAHYVLGAVVEMIHTATLVHDDVLDEAALRRHADTINARYDNEASVLLGDLLFTHAFHLAATLDSAYACRVIGQATNRVCDGELRQVLSRGDAALDRRQYLSIVEAKTAELCACACRLGAHYAQQPAAVEDALARFGREAGIAFQIVDDLLDLWGDEAQAGKSLGSDLTKQKLTLPLILLLEQIPPARRDDVLVLWQSPDPSRRQQLLAWLEEFDCRSEARRCAEQHAQRARGELAALPPSPYRDALEAVTRFVIDRRR